MAHSIVAVWNVFDFMTLTFEPLFTNFAWNFFFLSGANSKLIDCFLCLPIFVYLIVLINAVIHPSSNYYCLMMMIFALHLV
jgi:hypothetical protein